jgi:hypothetical protein
MNKWTETIELGGINWEVTCEFSGYEPATHTDPAVPAEFYAVSIVFNGFDWLEYFTPVTVAWFAEQVREKME